jgi:ABC-type nickel/cobalt efflux system permease component RcnA
MGTAMFGLDDRIADLAQGGGPALVLCVALLLGLRHASDPDHLAAVSTLIASDPENGRRRAGRLGLAWGVGHALTLALFGLPVVLLQAYLPDPLQRAAEAAVGVVIMVLALRLLLRWRRGHFHAHPHRHGDVEHRHLHPHHTHAHEHAHDPGATLGRTRWQAFGIGLVHGMGGSAGVSILLLATISDKAEAVAALLVLAVGTALSMAALSSAFGYAITRGPVLTRMLALSPAMGVVTLAFGGWYVLGAIGAVPYVL